jgi:hypothetical protein
MFRLILTGMLASLFWSVGEDVTIPWSCNLDYADRHPGQHAYTLRFQSQEHIQNFVRAVK